VADADRNRLPVVLQHANQALRDLLQQLPAETDDERRFRQDGLVIVLLAGEILSGRKYDQFRQQLQLEKTVRSGRIAYLDDLDLLRILPAPADDRFRALLELALPRFPDSLSQTYQNSDAVRPRMFFGRRDELARLESENGATVVFSGRKMGKSSLLSRLQAQCSADTDQRAILVGCSGIANGRSWMVLREIERELERLLAREAPGAAPALLPAVGLIDDPAKAMQLAKDRFRQVLDNAMARLEARNVRRMYVLLDEADNFVRAELEETSGGKDPRAAVSWFLRDLQTSAYRGRLRFIFAGYDQVGRIYRDPGLGHSAFGNWGGSPLRLGPLDETAAWALVVKPLAALGIIVSDELAERILDYTSGHASLIQAFCHKLAERVRTTQAAWPLNDVAIEFDDLQAVADDQHATGDQNYRQLLEQTLGLNLDIARAYPLKLLFLALVSPTGLGAGGVLGSNPFTLENALGQIQDRNGSVVTGVDESLLQASLDLLAQLGLLEDVSSTSGRAYAFKARHYVNVLRTKNGFRAQLQQALDEWSQSGRRATQVEPRYVWTLPDSDLRTLRQKASRPAVVLGLHGSGRGYLAEMLASPFADGDVPQHIQAGQSDFAGRLEALFDAPPALPVVVSDPEDSISWPIVSGWLRRALDDHLPLRWVGGPKLAWALAGDLETALSVDGPYSLGPLTPAELEPWAAREMGGDSPPSIISVPDADRGPLLRLTGGLLPVLELFREWLLSLPSKFPDPLRQEHAQRFLAFLNEHSAMAVRGAERLARGLPPELRTGLHHLFCGAHEWGEDTYSRSDLFDVSPPLEQLGNEQVTSLLDAAGWLRLLGDGGGSAQVFVPHASVLGLLIRQPRFAAP
jgi:hypothetical protein